MECELPKLDVQAVRIPVSRFQSFQQLASELIGLGNGRFRAGVPDTSPIQTRFGYTEPEAGSMAGEMLNGARRPLRAKSSLCGVTQHLPGEQPMGHPLRSTAGW